MDDDKGDKGDAGKNEGAVDGIQQGSPPGFAIIGMACRLPGAVDWRSFWRNLCDGVESVTFFSDQEMLAAGVDPAALRDPDYVKAGFLLPEPEHFDAGFFGYSPLQARLIDPQHRLMLETAWETFEDAGYAPGQPQLQSQSQSQSQLHSQGPVGVYATTGSIVTSYLMNALNDHPDSHGNTGSLIHFGNDKDFAGTRVSFKLDLRGPSLNVQTACSSSLMLIHLACQAIRNGECKLAAVLGSTMRVPHAAGYQAIKGGIMSPDGHVRTFDAEARGTVFSSGTAGVLIKALDQALADGDHIYAVVRGSAVNNDGARKKSYASPSAAGQAEAIRAAISHAGVHPDTIGYVECHGTGTYVGDPVEVEALMQAFGGFDGFDQNGNPGGNPGKRKRPCLIGSVKPNIGHSEQSAGLASLIKTALALSHGEIPATLNYATPNPRIFDNSGFENSGFEVATRLTPWPSLQEDGHPRRALVNGLGVGGTNAAVVLEQAPVAAARPPVADRPAHLFVLSAKSEKALEQTAGRHLAWLKTHETSGPSARLEALGDICHTLAAGRTHFEYRFATVVSSTADLAARLAQFHAPQVAVSTSAGTDAVPAPRKVAFLYSGQGAQTVGMGRQLYLGSQPFRQALDRVAKAMLPWLDRPLLAVLFDADSPIDQTRYTQPALFAIQVALAQLLATWGIKPDAVLGHSVGEFAAAHLAGVYTLEQAARLICGRGRLMQALPDGGGMVAVMAGETVVRELLAAMLEREIVEQGQPLSQPKIAIAAVNSAQGCVLSGELALLETALKLLEQHGIATRTLKVSHAFHSALMAPMLDPLHQIASEIVPQAPALRWISTLDGQPVSAAPTPDYWCRQARNAVRFDDAVQTLIADGITDFIEIGPGNGLLTHLLGAGHLPKNSLAVPSLGKGDEWANLLETLARLYRHGHAINWAGFDAPYRRCRVSLPTYAFERQRIWPDDLDRDGSSAHQARLVHSMGKSARLASPANAGATDEGWAGIRLPSPLPSQQFESVYSRSTTAWLEDHRIHGAIVLPVTAGLMAALGAAAQHFGHSDLEIVNFTHDEPMVLGNDEERLCHLLIDPLPDPLLDPLPDPLLEPVAKVASSPGIRFMLASTRLDDETQGAQWRRHMQGEIRPRAQAGMTGNGGGNAVGNAVGNATVNEARFEADAVRRRCPQTVVAERYYAVLKRLGLGYGPAFHGLQSLWRGNGEALARVRLPDRIISAIGMQNALHPALLGACLQVYSAVVEAHGDFSRNPPGGALAWLPLAIERCVFAPSEAREVWVHVRHRQQRGDHGIIDLDVWDVQGASIARFEGIVAGALPVSVFRPQTRQADDGWLYRMQWEMSALPQSLSPVAANLAGPAAWLVLGGDRDGTAAALKTALAAHGASCNVLPASEVPDTEPEFGTLVDALARQTGGNEAGIQAGIVVCTGIDAAANRVNWADPVLQERVYGRVMALARALVAGRGKFRLAPRLWLLTRNGAAVIATDPPVDVLQAGLWGLGRSLALEIPTLWAGLVDLQANVPVAAEAQLLAAQLLSGDGETQTVLRNGQRQVLRLVRLAHSALPPRQVRPAHAGTWLVTGGLGGLGLQVAHWLAKNRVTPTLVLVSRQGMDAANANQVKHDLEALGARVLIIRADVGNPLQVQTLMADLAQITPQLSGIYHIAGVRADALLEQMDWSKFRQALNPKLDAAWLLHHYSLGFALEEFVLFSSMLSLFGSTGQTNYTTANACLDALAMHRKSLGLPALAVNWGPWAGEGMAASMGEQGEALWRGRGVHFISPELGRRTFDALFDATLNNAAVGLLDWPVFLRQFPVPPPFYTHLQGAAGEGGTAAAGNRMVEELRNALASGDATERRGALVGFLSRQAMTILGLPEPADPKRPLHELGLDSMMSIEMINSVDAAIGVRIPMAKLITGPCINNLVDQVWPELAKLAKFANTSIPAQTGTGVGQGATFGSGEDSAAGAGARAADQAARQTDSPSGEWMVRVVPRDKPRFRVFCFPYAGGGSATFQSWGPDLDSSIELIAVEPPGRLARVHETPITDMRTFVDGVVQAMIPLLDVPFAFFGHCLGSLTLYEVARRLVQLNGPRPAHLFCSGARPPDRVDFIGPFERSLARRLPAIPGYLRGVPPYRQPDSVFAEIIRHFDMAAMEQLLGDPELCRLMLPVVRAEFEMASNYRFRQERPWDMPITCFIAKGDSYVSRQDILSWGRFTNNRMQVFMREGTHYSIHEDAAFFQRVISRELTAPPI